MARYRKIDTRMWGDAKFRSLSQSGRYLWMFLLTGPHTTNLPGLFGAGEMALVEDLGWTVKGFRKGFAELSREGLVKADWTARVAWIPKAIKYNPPDNPNVVKSWRDSWDEVPECSLKTEAYKSFEDFTEGLGEGFVKAFRQGCGKGLSKGLANQEQEQEQEKNSWSELKPGSDQMSVSPSKRASATLPQEAYRLAALLKSEIRRNKADYRITPAEERKWAVTADRMLRLDDRSYQESADLIAWAQHDEFWLKTARRWRCNSRHDQRRPHGKRRTQ